jgi:hypothetical protein
MGEPNVIDAVKRDDFDSLERLISEGADVNYQDEHGWTPVSWAAGKGDARMVKLLLDSGADVSLACKAGRTPLMIARAAGRPEAAQLLTAAEKARGGRNAPGQSPAYCRHYLMGDLRNWENWPAQQGDPLRASAREARNGKEARSLSDDEIVYLHQDFTVTRSVWPGEDVVFDEVTPEWVEFCRRSLNFSIPENL